MNSPFEIGSPLVEGANKNITYDESDFDGYSAAPVCLIGEDADPELVARQHKMSETFAVAVHGEFNGIVRPSVENFVIHSIRNRMRSREGQNSAAYHMRLHREPMLDYLPGVFMDDVHTACEAIKTGRASVRQAYIARLALGMTSIEFANLTMVGSFRRELEEHMWEEVSDLVGSDARPVSPSDYYRVQALGFDRPLEDAQHLGAVRVGLKRKLGVLSDGTEVKARTTAVVNVGSTSGVARQDVMEMIHAGREHRSIVDLPSFHSLINRILENDFTAPVLARNVTIYGFNPETAHHVKMYKADTAPLNILQRTLTPA